MSPTRRAPDALLALALTVALVAPGVAVTPAAADPAAPEPGLVEGITARGAVLYDPAEETVLWERDAGVAWPMASTTKIMTTLLAMEAGTVDDVVTVSAQAARVGGASLGLVAGQRIPMRSLLAGLMLRSGNDAAVAVAEHVAGSVEAFTARMNARAEQLGMRDTHFLNPSGLTGDPAHRASPLDLARLTAVALRHEELAAWSAARTLTVPGLSPMENRNLLVGAYPGADGVKTGFLEHARYALVASATRDGLTLYAVVLGSEDHFGDARRLLDHGFAGWRRVRALDDGVPAAAYRWAGAAVQLVAAGELATTARRDADAAWRTVLAPHVRLPVRAGQVLGQAVLVVDGERRAGVALVAAGDVTVPSRTDPAAAAGAALHDAVRALVRLAPLERPLAGAQARSSPVEAPAEGSAEGFD